MLYNEGAPIVVIIFIFFLSSNLVAKAHIIKCEEVGCSEFELRPLHKLCNVMNLKSATHYAFCGKKFTTLHAGDASTCY